MMIPIEGHKNLYRDEKTGAIINSDSLEYTNYIKVKKNIQSQKDQISELKNDINQIKNLLENLKIENELKYKNTNNINT